MFGKFYCHDIVTQELLRYTFQDVIPKRFRASLTHTADAALVASMFFREKFFMCHFFNRMHLFVCINTYLNNLTFAKSAPTIVLFMVWTPVYLV